MSVHDSFLLEWLMTWYQLNCDGHWEHQYGIKIETLDNPGWSMKIDLQGTPKSGSVLPYKLVERTESDWVGVSVTDNKFDVAGGPGNLLEMIGLFKDFVEGRLKADEPA